MVLPVTGRKIRVGLIGTGGIAAVHANCYQSLHDQAEVVAICDIAEERVAAFAERFQIPQTYTNYHDVIARSDVDMIDICTPPHVHGEITLAALHAGKPVYCEKPFAASLEEIDRVIAAEQETGILSGGVSQLRWGQGLQQVRALQQQGVLGKTLWGLCETAWYRDDAYYAVPWRGRWESELGGVTLGLAIHAIDTFMTVMGKPVSVEAMIGALNHQIQVEDTSAAIVRFENGAIAQLFATANCHRQFTRHIFGFKNATAESDEIPYNMTEPTYRITSQNPEIQQQINEYLEKTNRPPQLEGIHARQIAEYLGYVRGETTPTITAAESRKAIELITALYKSAFTKQRVELPITNDDPFYSSLHGGYASKS